MNILFLSPEIPYPAQSGHHLRTLNVLKMLARSHRIHFVGFAQHREDYRYIPQLGSFCESVTLFPIAPKGYNPAFFTMALKNCGSPYPLVAQRYCTAEARRWIQKLLDRHPFDLVHIDMLALGLYHAMFPKIPVFLTNHNVESLRLYRWSRIEKNALLRLYLKSQYHKLRRFEQEICPVMDRCIVVSETDRDHLQSLCRSDNFTVVPNGVDTTYFRPMPTPLRANHLVWVGGMGSPYNADAVDYFLTAVWPIITQTNGAVTVEFIGESPTATLRRLAMEDPRIRITGLIEDIRPAVSAASVFIAPIRSGSGTKIKVLNAMAQAKAVVATPVAAEGIAGAHGEHLLIGDTAESFAEAVVRLLAQPDLARRLGAAARDLIEERYSWQVICRTMDQLYSTIGTSTKGL